MVVKFLKNNIPNIKYIYTFIYMVLFSLLSNPYVDLILGDLYTAFVFFGIVVLVLDFFLSGILLKFKYSWLLVLFYISCIISIVINITYDPIGNFKVVVWMLIQTFVIATVNGGFEKESSNKLRWLVETVSAIWFIGTVISLILFFIGYSDYFETDRIPWGYARIGFMEGRLFGVFTDPNYASICVLFSAIFTLVNMSLYKDGKVLRIYHIVLLITAYMYIVLSGSRTAEICLYVAIVIFTFFAVSNYLQSRDFKPFKKYVLALIAAMLCFVLSVGVYEGTGWSAKQVYVWTSGIANDFEEGHDFNEDLIRPDVENSEDLSNGRLTIFKDYLEVSLNQPIFGTGPRNGLEFVKRLMPDSFVARRGYSYHNGYMALWVGSGLVGTVIMLAFLIMNIKQILSYLFRRNGQKDKNYLPIALMTSLLAAGAVGAVSLLAVFFNNSAYDIIFWFAFGYTLTLIRISEPERYKKEPTAYRLSGIFRIKSKTSDQSQDRPISEEVRN